MANIKYKYTKEMLEDAVKKSESYTDVMRFFNMKIAGGNHAHIKRRIQKLGIDTGHFQVQEAIITLAISAPTAIFYWQNFDLNATPLEARVYRTFAGRAIPALFATIAATFTVNTVITWATGGDAYWHDVPSTTATAIVLAAVIAYFKNLVAGFERDLITRIFQYLISGMAMFGIAIATGALVAGLLDTTDNNDAIIFGVSLLITTLPTWFITWRKCQFALAGLSRWWVYLGI